jgi:glycerol-3-phosphate dehydrogenase (NAD(P)+)
VALGEGKPPAGALAEGVATAPALVARAKVAGVEMPIAEAVADLLGGKVTQSEAVLRLMGRPLKSEK